MYATSTYARRNDEVSAVGTRLIRKMICLIIITMCILFRAEIPSRSSSAKWTSWRSPPVAVIRRMVSRGRHCVSATSPPPCGHRVCTGTARTYGGFRNTCCVQRAAAATTDRTSSSCCSSDVSKQLAVGQHDPQPRKVNEPTHLNVGGLLYYVNMKC